MRVRRSSGDKHQTKQTTFHLIDPTETRVLVSSLNKSGLEGMPVVRNENQVIASNISLPGLALQPLHADRRWACENDLTYRNGP